MILDTLQKIKLYQILFFIDADLAERLRLKACPICGAPLHVSNYPRKPRGGPDNIPDAYLIRHSLCCSEEGCRKRALPVSCRFWNRKVYWGIVILVAMTLQQGRTKGYSVGKLQRMLGISRHTLKRWMIYFRQVFPFSKDWQRIKGRIGFNISHSELPGAVVLFYIKQSESLETGVIQALKFLCGGFEMA
jgi:hypothetical protein